MACTGGSSVILKIILLVLLLLIISFLIVLLEKLFVPALKSKTEKDTNMLFADHQHIFTKLKPVEQIKEVTAKAFVLCNSEKSFEKKQQLKTIQGQTCALVNSIYNSLNDCKFSCIGLGDCRKVCKQRAIVIKNETAVITNLCIGCGACVEACPKHIIKLMPLNAQEPVQCANESLELTTCNSYKKDLKTEWTDKKGFKIWAYCYKLFYKK